MKLLYTLFLLISCSVLQAQQITTAEYFFDTDPGIGNATAVSFSSGDLDSTINFSTGDLSAGLHIFNVRLKNATGHWSTTYQSGILISNGIAGDASIVSGEYFFDTDPGLGNGIQLPVNKPSLDEAINFDVSGLTPGSHTIYIRLKNTVNAWSFPYQGTFVLSSGSGATQINSLEYFSEVDLGVGHNAIVPFVGGAATDTTFSIPVPDNGSDSSVLGLRLGNRTGQTGNATLNTVSLCDLYKPDGGFRDTRYANGYNFIDTALYNPSGKIQWLIDGVADTAYNNSRLYSYTFPSGFAGFKTLGEVTGSGCRVDTVNHSIYMSGIESIAPEGGFLKHDYVMNIFGGGLDTSAVIYLKSGSSVVYPYDKTAYMGKLLTATFDFHDVTFATPAYTNYYDLHVHLSNGYDTVLIQKVTIADLFYGGFENSFCSNEVARRTNDHRPSCESLTEGDKTFITVNLTGSTVVKAGVWNYFTVNATNESGVLAKKPVIWVMIPAENEVVFDVDYYIPTAFKDPSPTDTLPTEWIPIDTVIDGTRQQYKLYGFIPVYMTGGETRSINFKMRSTAVSEQTIHCWAQKPMFGSPLKSYWNCTWDLLGYAPIAGCVTGLYDWATTKGNTIDNQDDPAHGHAYNAAKFFGSYWLSTTSAAVSCGGGKLTAAFLKKSATAIATIEKIESKIVDKTLGTINNQALTKNGCWDLDYLDDLATVITTVAGFDPNHLTGNSQYDNVKHYINNLSPQYYEAAFENLPAATAKTQHVYITDTLDKDKFNFSTFRYTGYRIADSFYSVPPFRNTVYQTFPAPGRTDMSVLFVGSFDTLTGIIRSDFFSMNAAGTKVLADTSLDGFLPPNTDGVSGTGSVQFQVGARDLNTLDTFKNVAHVYFDNNEPVKTNFWMNTVDTTSPGGRILQADRINDTIVKLTVQKSDIGSGFAYNKLYAKTPSDTMFHFLGNFSADTIRFIGIKDSSYQFYTQAIDQVGNKQSRLAVSSITYTFNDLPLPVHLLSFSANKNGNKVKLLWVSANEVDFSHYVVERSADGLAFTGIATVVAKGGPVNNTYLLYDEHPLDKANYYRLKQFDKDGSYTYSRIIRVDFDKAFTLSLTPVPARSNIIIDGAENFKQIQLVDMSGRVVKQFSQITGNVFEIGDLSPGMYLVRLISDNAVETLKMVKQ